MRTAFCKALHEIMLQDGRVFILTADIGYMNFDEIRTDFPDRFINTGVAEANMIGISAGLALCGKIPFTFTIAPFATMRCLEQIRVGLCFQKLPVKIIGAGGGFVYGPQGTSHHAIEELGILRTVPHMTVISPADPIETRKSVFASLALEGPAYIRIGRNHEPAVHTEDVEFKIGKATTLQTGDDITIIANGLVVKNALEAADLLTRRGISARVISMHTVKPIDRETILKSARETKGIVTVEEHNVLGGLGGAVSEILSEDCHFSIPFKRLGINDTFVRIHADHEKLQETYNLDGPSIARISEELIRKNSTASGLGNSGRRNTHS
jgi:transketolase